MPGTDVAYALPEQDLYPESQEEHDALLSWMLQAFSAADEHRSAYEIRWQRYYRLYRLWLKRDPGDWRSKVFIPHVFSVIETIAPRLLAQLPEFVATPMGPEDVAAAQAMETLMNWSGENSGLHVELVKTVKSTLKYGTGIMKNFHRVDVRRAWRQEQVPTQAEGTVQAQLLDSQGRPVLDIEGQPMMGEERVPVEGPPESLMMPYEFVSYEGPATEAVDIFNFWPAPEATDVQSARYVIQRTYREMSHILEMAERGVYRLPENMGPADITATDEEPLAKRLATIDLGASNSDPTRRPVEILEFWTDDTRVMTLANRKAILRVAENPFWHGQKPYVRMVDYLQEHEFWGVGEIEVLEGLQDLQNALINQRVDNVRLNMNSMYAVNKDAVTDLRQLKSRPGGIVEVTGDVPLDDALKRLELGDVTAGAFAEAAEGERLIEKTSGVTSYQTGIDSPSQNDTATGVALITELGNTKFAMKLKLIELMGLRDLAAQWGAILQQFTSAPRVIRLLGPDGQWLFQTFDPESIQGALDYSIATASSAQTETLRRQQDMTLLQLLAGVWPYAVPQLVIDLLRSFGKKDLAAYLMGPQASAFDPLASIAAQQLAAPVPPEAEGTATPGEPYALPPSLLSAQVQTRLAPRTAAPQ